MTKNKFWKMTKNKFWDQIWEQVRDQVRDQSNKQINHQIYKKLDDYDQIYQINDQVKIEVWYQSKEDLENLNDC